MGEKTSGRNAIVLSEELSGTLDSACTAAANLPDVPIEIIDSRGCSMMTGFPVLAAAEAAAAGQDLAGVAGAARALIGWSSTPNDLLAPLELSCGVTKGVER